MNNLKRLFKTVSIITVLLLLTCLVPIPVSAQETALGESFGRDFYSLPEYGELFSPPQIVGGQIGEPIVETFPTEVVKVTETPTEYIFNNGARIWHFGKDGLNAFYSLDGHPLAVNEQFVAIKNGIEQIPKKITVSWIKEEDYLYVVTESYTCANNLIYETTYSFKWGSSLKTECLVTSGEITNVTLEWRFENSSSFTQKDNKISFANGISFDYNDVERTFGKITTLDIKSVPLDTSFAKQKISFNLGTITPVSPKLLDPDVGGIELYWIGDSGNYTDNVTHWSLASGGAADAPCPTLLDDVNFDVNSFTLAGQVVTVNETSYCYNMDWTGATNIPTLAFGEEDILCYGSITFIADMVTTGTVDDFIRFYGVSSNLTTNGLLLNARIGAYGAGSKLTLLDELNISGFQLTCTNTDNTLDTNNQTVTCGSVVASGDVVRTLTFGNSTINCGSFNALDGTNLTVTANTATINTTGYFYGGGIATYNIVKLTGATSTVSGNNTFVDLILPSGTTQNITFASGESQTISANGTFSGSVGHVHTFSSNDTANYELIKVGGGTVVADYMSISRSNAYPAAETFYAGYHSTDGGNNLGWYFNNQNLALITEAISGVTMNRDGVTAATFNGTLAGLVGTSNTTLWFEYGLTIAYGTKTTNVTTETTPIHFTASALTNLLPGNTYHYAAVGANDASNVTYSADANFTYTMPTVANLRATEVDSSRRRITTAVDISSMGEASDSYLQTSYGYTLGTMNTTSPLQIITGTGTPTSALENIVTGQEIFYKTDLWNGGSYVTLTGRVTPQVTAERNMINILPIVFTASIIAAIVATVAMAVSGISVMAIIMTAISIIIAINLIPIILSVIEQIG